MALDGKFAFSIMHRVLHRRLEMLPASESQRAQQTTFSLSHLKGQALGKKRKKKCFTCGRKYFPNPISMQ